MWTPGLCRTKCLSRLVPGVPCGVSVVLLVCVFTCVRVLYLLPLSHKDGTRDINNKKVYVTLGEFLILFETDV